MQLIKNKLKTFTFILIFAALSVTAISAQTGAKTGETKELKNRIGKGITPFVEYDPLTAPVAKRPAGTKRPYADFFGTGRTSFAVYDRFIGAPVRWKIQSNGTNETRFLDWGRDDFNYTDSVNPGYFDGDDKADVAVWRKNLNDGSGTFFINPSTAPDSMQVVQWGLQTDLNIRLSADYDGDGRDDLTVARRVGNSWVWYYLRSSDNSFGAINFGIAGAGAGTDLPETGADYNGDGRADLVVIRRNADGTATYYVGDSITGQIILIQQWGIASGDVVVTGDFIGDERADFAVWRGERDTGDGFWYIKENGGDQIVAIPFGIPGMNFLDRAIRGDYNGDGKDDIAIYRTYRNAQSPDNNTFYWLNSPNFDTLGAFKFGSAGNIPVANQ